MNPIAMMKLKPMLEQFGQRHPKFIQFFGAATPYMGEGSKLEIRITNAEGKTIATNLLASPEDLELLDQLKTLLK